MDEIVRTVTADGAGVLRVQVGGLEPGAIYTLTLRPHDGGEHPTSDSNPDVEDFA